MEYGGLNCRGTESSIQQCSVTSTFVTAFSDLLFSNQRDYAGVKCIPKTSGNDLNDCLTISLNQPLYIAQTYAQMEMFDYKMVSHKIMALLRSALMVYGLVYASQPILKYHHFSASNWATHVCY